MQNLIQAGPSLDQPHVNTTQVKVTPSIRKVGF